MSGQNCTSKYRHICALTLDIAVTDSPPPPPRTPIYSRTHRPTHTPHTNREREKKERQINQQASRERERASQKERQINKQADKQTIESKYDSMVAHRNRNMRFSHLFAANLMLE